MSKPTDSEKLGKLYQRLQKARYGTKERRHLKRAIQRLQERLRESQR